MGSFNVDFPLRVDATGRTALTDDADHIRDMMELLLFTHPGERVMRPDFGSGVMQYVFAPNSPELAATLQLTVQASLTQWLGDVIDVREVLIESDEAELRVFIGYAVRATGEQRDETFIRSVT